MRKYPVDPSMRCTHTQTHSSFSSAIDLRALNACSMKTIRTVEFGAARRQRTGRRAPNSRWQVAAVEVLLVSRLISATARAKVKYTKRAA